MLSTLKRLYSRKWAFAGLTVLGIGLVGCVQIFSDKMPQSPDILVVGDSQISFGAGQVYLEFFQNIKSNCPALSQRHDLLEKLGERQTAAIGVRSSSLHSWTARDGKNKDTICEIDKKWGVNAGVYGIAGNPDREYVQIGQGNEYQFCKANRSSFEAMFAAEYYKPKFLLMAFLGNSAERWANSERDALKDVENTMRQIPENVPCAFLTTAPAYDLETNNIRPQAQENVKKAFQNSGSRCTFVEGFTPETRSAATGNVAFFKTNEDGEVTDPHHPNIDAARTFLSLRTPALCEAVIRQLSR